MQTAWTLVEIDANQPELLRAVWLFIDDALRGARWYRPEGSIIGRAITSGAKVLAAVAPGPGDELLGVVVTEAHGDGSEPGLVRFVPWCPLISPSLDRPAARALGRSLVESAIRGAGLGFEAARYVMRYTPADAERAETIIEAYRLAGFGADFRTVLGLELVPGAHSRETGAAQTSNTDLRIQTNPVAGAVDPTAQRDMELLTDLFMRAFADSPDPEARRTASSRASTASWLDEQRGLGPAPTRRGRFLEGFWRVAYADGEAVGLVLVNDRGENTFYVADMGVVPEMRGQGLAGRMLDEVIRLLRGRVARDSRLRVEAIVHQDNIPSLRLFSSAGFAVSESLVVMTRSLPWGTDDGG